MDGTDNSTESGSEIRERVLERDEYECLYCGVGEPVATVDVHHIVPAECNGSDDLDNLLTLCLRCQNSLHELGDGPEYPITVLERAEEENQQQKESQNEDTREKETVPEGWERNEWLNLTKDTDAPARATVTTKSINGNVYYYYQWREGEKIKSEYIAPANRSE